MNYIFKIVILSILLAEICFPVSALVTNVSPSNGNLISNSVKHDSNYIPFEYEILFIALGLFCLIVSRVYESAEDIFAASAIVPCIMATWFANYMAIERTSTVVISGVVTIVNTQIITPSAYLSVMMAIVTICAILNGYWVFFMKGADKKTETK
jgi:hypothetical protein